MVLEPKAKSGCEIWRAIIRFPFLGDIGAPTVLSLSKVVSRTVEPDTEAVWAVWRPSVHSDGVSEWLAWERSHNKPDGGGVKGVVLYSESVGGSLVRTPVDITTGDDEAPSTHYPDWSDSGDALAYSQVDTGLHNAYYKTLRKTPTNPKKLGSTFVISSTSPLFKDRAEDPAFVPAPGDVIAPARRAFAFNATKGTAVEKMNFNLGVRTETAASIGLYRPTFVRSVIGMTRLHCGHPGPTSDGSWVACSEHPPLKPGIDQVSTIAAYPVQPGPVLDARTRVVVIAGSRVDYAEAYPQEDGASFDAITQSFVSWGNTSEVVVWSAMGATRNEDQSLTVCDSRLYAARVEMPRIATPVGGRWTGLSRHARVVWRVDINSLLERYLETERIQAVTADFIWS